jgi:hypothetical protein
MDISQFHGTTTTWVITDRQGNTHLPYARIGSITATCIDLIISEEKLVWLSVVVPTSGINMQDPRHIVAILAGSGKKERVRSRAGSVVGWTHPVFTGEHAPETKTMQDLQELSF